MEQLLSVRGLYLPTGGLTAGSVAGVVSMVTPGGGVFGGWLSPGSADLKSGTLLIFNTIYIRKLIRNEKKLFHAIVL